MQRVPHALQGATTVSMCLLKIKGTIIRIHSTYTYTYTYTYA